MERVAFLLEKTGERISCLLNPASVVMRRSAGVQRRRSTSGALSGTMLADEPLVVTGGGRTEIELNLLFDVDVAGSSVVTRDVRDLTRPLWALAENTRENRPAVPLVRLVWGKSWNLPGVVEAVAERLERFESDGSPGRSWLRMRMVRVAEPPAETQGPQEASVKLPEQALPESWTYAEEEVAYHDLLSGVSDAAEQGAAVEGTGQRLDEVAAEHYGDPSLGKLIAAFNDLADPLRLVAGTRLALPPLRLLSGRSEVR